MGVNEIVFASQNLSFDQIREVIRALLKRLPEAEPFGDSIAKIGDLEAGSLQIREQISESIQRSALELDEFERDMDALADGLDHLPPLPADFSRADIYDDHD